MAEKVTRRGFMGAAAAWGAAACGEIGVGSDQPQRDGAIIDAHVHLKHGNAARTEYSPEVIVETMDRAGIQKSIVFAISTTTQRSIEMAEAAVRRYPDRLIPYVYALPHYERPVIREIEAALGGGLFRGVKIHVGECTLAGYVVDPVLKAAGKHGAPCLIDCGGNLAAARRMAEAFPETRLIIAHMGLFLSTNATLIDQFIGLAETHANVLLDTSGVVLGPKIAEAVRRIGSKRLIWGTDGPDRKPDTETYARGELEKILDLKLNATDEANILGGTIRGLLGL